MLNKTVIEAVSNAAELAYNYYKGCVKAGFTDDQAMHLTISFVNQLIAPEKEKQNIFSTLGGIQ